MNPPPLTIWESIMYGWILTFTSSAILVISIALMIIICEFVFTYSIKEFDCEKWYKESVGSLADLALTFILAVIATLIVCPIILFFGSRW